MHNSLAVDNWNAAETGRSDPPPSELAPANQDDTLDDVVASVGSKKAAFSKN